jgi:hypothetical protein
MDGIGAAEEGVTLLMVTQDRDPSRAAQACRTLRTALRRSVTQGQARGVEMSCHPKLARRLKIGIWFCDPHSPFFRADRTKAPPAFRASSCPRRPISASSTGATSTTSPGS